MRHSIILLATTICACTVGSAESELTTPDGGNQDGDQPGDMAERADGHAADLANHPPAHDLAPQPQPDLLQCGARMQTCGNNSPCCSGMWCNPASNVFPPTSVCCIPQLGPASAGCDSTVPAEVSGCCTTANVTTICQPQAGIGVCCRPNGSLCVTDNDCCHGKFTNYAGYCDTTGHCQVPTS